MEDSFPATERQAEPLIREQVSVTPQKIRIAKEIILQSAKVQTSAEYVIGNVLDVCNAPHGRELSLWRTFDSTADIRAIAERFSWRIAAAEAILGLVHSGLLVDAAETKHKPSFYVKCSHGLPGSHHGSAVMYFPDYEFPLPAQLRRAPSVAGNSSEFLSDHDLFLNTLSIGNLHPDVESALIESVKCFRHDLFAASVAMLGKASEGAWIDLGATLLTYVPSERQSSVKKQRETLENTRQGTMNKIDSVITLFNRQDIFEPIASASGVKPDDLGEVQLWSDLVRDSRNTIHFGVKPSTPDTYEKVAALLLGAAPKLRILYSLKSAAHAALPES
jgi:hypothetical protein